MPSTQGFTRTDHNHCHCHRLSPRHSASASSSWTSFDGRTMTAMRMIYGEILVLKSDEMTCGGMTNDCGDHGCVVMVNSYGQRTAAERPLVTL